MAVKPLGEVGRTSGWFEQTFVDKSTQTRYLFLSRDHVIN